MSKMMEHWIEVDFNDIANKLDFVPPVGAPLEHEFKMEYQIDGKYYPSTLLTPAEYPSIEWCTSPDEIADEALVVWEEYLPDYSVDDFYEMVVRVVKDKMEEANESLV